MSLKSFLSNVWEFFAHLWSNIEDSVKKNVHTAVIITEGVKRFIENPTGDFLLTIIDDRIPGDVKPFVKDLIDRVLKNLLVLENGVINNEMIQHFAQSFGGATDQAKDTFYHNLAVLIAQELSDGKLSFSDSIVMVEWYYRNKVK